MFPPQKKMHFKNKYTKEKKYKNLKKEDQHSRNKKWNPKGRSTPNIGLTWEKYKKNENMISLLIKQSTNAQHKINNKNPKNLLWNLLGNHCKLCKVANS